MGNKNKHFENKPFRRFVSTTGCSVPYCEHYGTYHEDVGAWLVDPHHVDEVGMGGNVSRDDVGNIIGLCRWHHTAGKKSIHALGNVKFEDEHDVRINSKARALGRKWRTKKAREREE